MSNIQAPIQPKDPHLHWPSMLQLILSLLASFILLGAAAVLAISAGFQYFNRSSGIAGLTQPLMVAASLAFAGVLVLPSAWYGWKHVAFPGSEPTPHPERRGTVLVLTVLVVILEVGLLFLGNWAAQNDQVAWFMLPILNLLATGLPAFWVIYIGTRGLIPGAPGRRWGVFAAGLVLGPLLILVLELVLFAIVGILAILWAMLNPSLANQMYGLAGQLQSSGPNLEGLVKALVPFMLNPGIIFLGFSLMSVLVPLLEEALKPIGVWFLAGQKLSPAQGFAYGIISGAGFGLFENLGNTSNGGPGWALLVSLRITTLLLHCFTAGLVGWALASAWNERRYLRLGITYALAVIIHGLWNALILLSIAAVLPQVSNVSLPTSVEQISTLAPGGVVFLAVVVFLLYIGFNTTFRRKISEEMLSHRFTHQLWEPSKRYSQAPTAQALADSTPGSSLTPPSTPGEDESQPGDASTNINDKSK